MSKNRSHGEGTIYYKSEKSLWAAQVSLPNGKRPLKYFKTQREAREWLLTIRKSIQDGIWTDTRNVTFEAFIDRFMSDVAAHTLREKTISSYEPLIRIHIKPEIGNLKLAALRPDHLQSLYARKLEAGLSKRTVQYIHSIIHRALDQALEWGLVSRNVADKAHPPIPKRREPHTLTPEQATNFLEITRQTNLFALYALTLGCGLRRGETLGMHWKDTDLDKRTIYVHCAIQQFTGKGLVLTEVKTESGRRVIAVPDFAVQALAEYMLQQEQIKVAAGDKWVENDLVFTTRLGTPIGPRNLVRHFKTCLEKAGLPAETRFHDLRHTTASLFLKANVHPKTVQTILGHSQISVTMDLYSHLFPGMQEEAAGKINELLK